MVYTGISSFPDVTLLKLPAMIYYQVWHWQAPQRLANGITDLSFNMTGNNYWLKMHCVPAKKALWILWSVLVGWRMILIDDVNIRRPATHPALEIGGNIFVPFTRRMTLKNSAISVSWDWAVKMDPSILYSTSVKLFLAPFVYYWENKLVCFFIDTTLDWPFLCVEIGWSHFHHFPN